MKLREFLAYVGLFDEWGNKQEQKFKNGEELEPPWTWYSESKFNLVLDNFYFRTIWLPFWINLNRKEREDYVKKWKPSKTWQDIIYQLLIIIDKDTFLARFGLGSWHEEQKQNMLNNEEVQPPHFVYASSIDSSSVREEALIEPWANNIWLPFWKEMNEKERRDYSEKWKVSEIWQKHTVDRLKTLQNIELAKKYAKNHEEKRSVLKEMLIRLDWVENPRPIERQRWNEEEKRKLKDGKEIVPPWVIYGSYHSPIDCRYDDWTQTVWRVFWNKMNEKEKAEYAEKWNMNDEWYDWATMFWTDKE